MQLETAKRLKRHQEETKKIANEILDEIRNSVQTYKEVKKELQKLKTAMMFNNNTLSKKTIIESVFMTAEMIIEEEISDLPLTNRLR